MSEPLHWVMASSQVTNVDDGSGRLLTLAVCDMSDGGEGAGWKWTAVSHPSNGREWMAGRGLGYPDPISARKAAEYWLSVTREQNAIRAALEAEAQS